MDTEPNTLTKLGSYALFMACNEIGQKYGKAVSAFHRALYRIVDAEAKAAGVTTAGERIVFDTGMKADVRGFFAEHKLDWADYVARVHAVYQTGTCEEVQQDFKLE